MKTGRNDPCPCGSGKKYKKCCLSLDESERRASAKDGASDAPLPAPRPAMAAPSRGTTGQ